MSQSAGGGASTAASTLPLLSVARALAKGSCSPVEDCGLVVDRDRVVAFAARFGSVVAFAARLGSLICCAGLSPQVPGSLAVSVPTAVGAGELGAMRGALGAACRGSEASCTVFEGSGQMSHAKANSVSPIAPSSRSQRLLGEGLGCSAGGTVNCECASDVSCCLAAVGGWVIKKRKGGGACTAGGKELSARLVPKGSVWIWPSSPALLVASGSVGAAASPPRAVGEPGTDALLRSMVVV
jgi:hypothetical protein